MADIRETLRNGNLSFAEHIALVPEIVASVLNSGQFEPEAMIGSWKMIEAEDGERGFESEFAATEGDEPAHWLVLRKANGDLYVAITHPFSEEPYVAHLTSGSSNPKSEKGEVTGIKHSQEDKVMPAHIRQFLHLQIFFALQHLGDDLGDFILGKEVLTHDEVRQRIMADMLGHEKKPRTKKKKE